MDERAARDVALMRAIESGDPGRAVLSDEDRAYASRSAVELAGWEASYRKTALTAELFLAKRAEAILKVLAGRMPAFARAAPGRATLRAAGVAAPILALLAGVAADRVASPERVDLLSPPLLLMVLWNLAMYLLLLVWLLAPVRRAGGFWTRLAARMPSPPRRLPQPLAAALAAFQVDWTVLSAPLTAARVRRILHLSAAMLALGTIVSLYARGLFTQYRVGWESTFLDAGQVHTLLRWLFAPATDLLGLRGFTPDEVAALHLPRGVWRGDGARWVHLYAATLGLLVVLPRLLLALWAGIRAAQLARRFPLDLSAPYYAELGGALGAARAAAVVRVLPFSLTLDEAMDRRLLALVRGRYGERAELMLRPPLAYGDDPPALPAGGAATHTIALLALSATPEAEIHGAFLARLKSATAGPCVAWLDQSGLRARLGDGERLRERAALWLHFCARHGVEAEVVDLGEGA